MSRVFEITTNSPDETREVGRAVGVLLRGGDVLCLDGPLGAGKTQFVKGLAVGIGVPEDEPVVSPTFVLVREYAGRLRLFHIDAYRLTTPEELLNIGFEEMSMSSNAVVAVEWAEHVDAAIGRPALHVEFAYSDDLHDEGIVDSVVSRRNLRFTVADEAVAAALVAAVRR